MSRRVTTLDRICCTLRWNGSSTNFSPCQSLVSVVAHRKLLTAHFDAALAIAENTIAISFRPRTANQK